MPWCDDCSKFWNPTSMGKGGECPTCGRVIAKPQRAPWHFKLMLVAPNGAGKTTTEGMLTTRVIPTSGQAIVGGVDVVAQPAKTKRLIGVVPQTNTLDRSLNVWENLYFHGRYFGMTGKQARAAAD